MSDKFCPMRKAVNPVFTDSGLGFTFPNPQAHEEFLPCLGEQCAWAVTAEGKDGQDISPRRCAIFLLGANNLRTLVNSGVGIREG